LYGSIVDADGVNDSWQDGVQLAGYEILIDELENEPVSFFQNETHLITANFDGSTGAKLIRLNRYDTLLIPLGVIRVFMYMKVLRNNGEFTFFPF
jgi:hypothetical protein